MDTKKLHEKLDKAIAKIQTIKNKKDWYENVYGNHALMIMLNDIDSELVFLDYDIKWAFRDYIMENEKGEKK